MDKQTDRWMDRQTDRQAGRAGREQPLTNPVEPNPPAMNLRSGNHETAQHEDDHEHAGATRISHHNVACDGSNGTEDADCQVVDQKQQQPAHEEPANSSHGS